MNNDELLRAIGELIQASEQRIRKDMATKQDVKEVVEANNRVLGTIVRAEIAAVQQELVKLGQNIAKRLNAQDESIEEIKNAIPLSKN